MEVKKAIFHLLPRLLTKHWSSWILLGILRDLEVNLRDTTLYLPLNIHHRLTKHCITTIVFKNVVWPVIFHMPPWLAM